MCGWIAVLGRRGQALERDRLQRATLSLAHRGPDDTGDYVSGGAAIGFRRLAIIDLSSGGHQPMTSDDGRLTLVFNGEIYNYRELSRELAAMGWSFRSTSDTEVLLTAFRQWGPDCVHRFNGMFAFAVYDQHTGTFFGARDRLGVKPLYFWQDSDWVVMASEPRAIGATGLVDLAPDWERVRQGLVEGCMDHGGGTCLANVRQVPAAHRFTVDVGSGMRHSAYWTLPEEDECPPAASPQGESEWVGQLSALLSDSVALRLRSDVPVGFTLSGGIDSSLLICEAAHQGHRDLTAFSYQDRLYDERQLIADTVMQTGARLHTIRDLQLDIATLLPRVIEANGEPVHSMSAVANFALYGLARDHGVKVLLGGQGADELFAGYRSFQQGYWHSLFADAKWKALIADVGASARLHGHGVAPVLFDTVRRAVRFKLSLTRPYQQLRKLRASMGIGRSSGLFSPELTGRTPPPFPTLPLRLQPSMRHAVGESPLPLYLRVEDRSSMFHSVEARLPFADYRIVEHALRMPDQLRFVQGMNKVALRRAAASRVPASVANRAYKYGFPVGSSERTATGLQRLCKDLMLNQACRERGIYDQSVVGQLLATPPRPEHTSQLFDLAQMELWLGNLQTQRESARV